jgi:phosphoglycerate kinase
MPKLSITDLSLNKSTVFIRVDFNVPLDEHGHITDDTRIRESMPTIEFAMGRGAKIVLASHLGRPKGIPNPKMSLASAARRLEELLHEKLTNHPVVHFAKDCVGPESEYVVKRLNPGEVCLLENLRFHPEEEANDLVFAKQLATLCEVYVNDAFGSAHRAHASTVGITKFVAQSAAGFLMEKELKYLGQALESPARPFVAVLGGAKVSDKIEVIQNLLGKVDVLLIGGAMAYTFLKSQGKSIGKSLVENDKLDLAMSLLTEAKGKLLLPIDHVLAEEITENCATKTASVNEPVPEDWMGLDIGPETIKAFTAELAKAKTIVWNGPMGVFECTPFASGTMAVAHAMASNTDCITIIGGGDSVAAVHKAGVAKQITHISTGGGASLEFLEGKKLPGVEALTDKPK